MEQPTPAMYAPAAGQQDITHTLTSVHVSYLSCSYIHTAIVIIIIMMIMMMMMSATTVIDAALCSLSSVIASVYRHFVVLCFYFPSSLLILRTAYFAHCLFCTLLILRTAYFAHCLFCALLISSSSSFMLQDGMPDRTVATMATPHFAGGEIDQETPRPSVQSSTAAAFPLFANPVTPSAASAFNLVSQMPSVVQQQPIHTAPRAASAFSSSSALSDQTVLDIPVPDVQTVKLLPPGYGGGSTGVSDSTSLTSSSSNSTANTSTVIMPANHDAHNGPAPPGSVIGAPRMQLVSEDEYCSTPQYLRFQLTFEVFNEILSAVNLIAQSPRGGTFVHSVRACACL